MPRQSSCSVPDHETVEEASDFLSFDGCSNLHDRLACCNLETGYGFCSSASISISISILICYNFLTNSSGLICFVILAVTDLSPTLSSQF